MIKQFGQWKVFDWGIEGDMGNGGTYDITKEELKNGDDWVRHMSEKNWVNLKEFTKAFDYFISLK